MDPFLLIPICGHTLRPVNSSCFHVTLHGHQIKYLSLHFGSAQKCRLESSLETQFCYEENVNVFYLIPRDVTSVKNRINTVGCGQHWPSDKIFSITFFFCLDLVWKAVK